MKRFFYTDPLAAAWMAKHFGMRFWNGAHEIQMLPLVDGEKAGLWHIHPDSLHLLQPQVGDLVVTQHDEAGVVTQMNPSGGLDFGRWFSIGEEGKFDSDNHKVVQRHGIAFHWPESVTEA